jgi:hypothetical protein
MIRRMLVAALSLTLIGCGDSNEPNNDDITGVYRLQTVNGQSLPFILEQTGQDKVELLSDVYTFAATGSFTQLTTYRITENGQVSTETEPDEGTWARSGSNITVTFSSGGSATGSIDGDEITVSTNGATLVYEKD